MLVCWNAELVSGRFAELAQVLCKLPEQPCMPVTVSPQPSGAGLCALVPRMEQGREGFWKAEGKRLQALVL